MYITVVRRRTKIAGRVSWSHEAGALLYPADERNIAVIDQMHDSIIIRIQYDETQATFISTSEVAASYHSSHHRLP